MKTLGSMSKCTSCPGHCCKAFMISMDRAKLKHAAKHSDTDGKLRSDSIKALKWFKLVPDHQSSWKLGIQESRLYTCTKLVGGKCAVYHERPTCCEGFDCNGEDIPPFESAMLCGTLSEAIFMYQNYGPVYRFYCKVRNFIFLNWTVIPKYRRWLWLKNLRRKIKRTVIPASIQNWLDKHRTGRVLERMGFDRKKREELYDRVERSKDCDCECEVCECPEEREAAQIFDPTIPVSFATENSEQSKARAFGRPEGQAILKSKEEFHG